MKIVLLKPSLLAFSLTLAVGAAGAGECPPCPETKTPVRAEVALPPHALYYNPWADIVRMRALLNAQFNPRFNPVNPLWMPVLPPPPTLTNFFPLATPTAALQASQEGYRLALPLPGFKDEEIQVKLEGRMLSISAETSSTAQAAGGGGQFRRSFAQTLTLPVAVQAADLKRHFENGVLTLILPAAKIVDGAV